MLGRSLTLAQGANLPGAAFYSLNPKKRILARGKKPVLRRVDIPHPFVLKGLCQLMLDKGTGLRMISMPHGLM